MVEQKKMVSNPDYLLMASRLEANGDIKGWAYVLGFYEEAETPRPEDDFIKIRQEGMYSYYLMGWADARES